MITENCAGTSREIDLWRVFDFWGIMVFCDLIVKLA
jgi:hypothetical protein